MYWDRALIGPFGISIFPPWSENDTWLAIIDAADAKELCEFHSASEREVKDIAFSWLKERLSDWQKEVEELLKEEGNDE